MSERTIWAVEDVLGWLRDHASGKVLDEMQPRYGIPNADAIGVTMADMKVLAKQVGHDHELAAGLWDSGWYEARVVAAMVDQPELVTPEQMERWCRSFDNWAICDTVCFNLFDRTPHAWAKLDEWSGADDEFVKRTAFALLWSLALHDKASGDQPFIHGLTLVEREAGDDRHYVKKAISMSLRAIAARNDHLKSAVADTATRLAASDLKSARSIGTTALRDVR